MRDSFFLSCRTLRQREKFPQPSVARCETMSSFQKYPSHPATPTFHFKTHFRTLRNLVFVPKRPVATCETRFQNHLALSHIATVVFKIIWGCNDSFRPFLMQLLIVWHVKQLPVIAVVTFELNCGCCIAG